MVFGCVDCVVIYLRELCCEICRFWFSEMLIWFILGCYMDGGDDWVEGIGGFLCVRYGVD